ncbi:MULTISPECIES: 5-methylcytosine restriction system specificity protein McrC [unclassified Aeromicrobium]|uniref:5-methylcytosine restriction system specificity protein McrC n=1 Tax=unclassified Aeromicrobium TaxID=2633570 RepID=UPI00396B3E24
MIGAQTLLEGGPAQPFTGTASDLDELRLRSSELASRLGLAEEPFVIDEAAGTVEVRGVAGFVSLGDSTIEIMPHFLRHDPGWRVSMLTILTTVHHLEWVPRVDRGTRHAGLSDLLGMIVAGAMGRASSEGVPRTYVERTAVTPSIRGQLDAGRMWRRVVDPYSVDCRFSEFVADGPVTSALKWACAELAGAVQQPWLESELRAYADLFPEASRELPPPAIMDGLQLTPQFGFLGEALDVARMLAMGPQNGTGGRADGPTRAFLWSTEQLFGDFVQVVAERAAKSAGFTAYRGGRSRRLNDAAATAGTVDTIVESDAELVAASVCARDYTEDLADEIAAGLISAGRGLGASDVAIVFPASMGLRPGTQMRVREAGGPSMLHLLTVDPSGLGESGGMARVVNELELDLGMVLTIAQRRPVGSRRRLGGTA